MFQELSVIEAAAGLQNAVNYSRFYNLLFTVASSNKLNICRPLMMIRPRRLVVIVAVLIWRPISGERDCRRLVAASMDDDFLLKSCTAVCIEPLLRNACFAVYYARYRYYII